MTAGIQLFAAKRGIFDTLIENLPDLQVAYSLPANLERTAVYGAGARFTRGQGAAEWNSITNESITVDVLCRVTDPQGDHRASDKVLEDLAGQVIAVLSDHRAIGNGLTFADIVFGQAPDAVRTPNPDPTITVRLLLQALVIGVTV